ncbi:hypothetical protein MtrunA17_Chr8g0354811 [Medicago truncatula]|uniref:Uncharacterized protein n=1 Tax=Medicago truncatula TaxID=3880 RepID=A0A396GP38_MEDTR|nr:hypothetical protein MtrunA17_Chr8g0354811 [Medicago truncatula]
MMLFYFCGHGNRRNENTNCNDTDYEEFMVLLNGTKITTRIYGISVKEFLMIADLSLL